jgi:thymidylate synthase
VEVSAYIHWTSSQAYDEMLGDLMDGEIVNSRHGKTQEMTSVLTIKDPSQIPVFAYGRRPNYFGMLAESLWILSDVNEVGVISKWNQRLKDFSDDGEHLYGAYGPRLISQIPHALKKLADDPDTRQVVLSIWQERDLTAKTKDYPCNDLVMFKIRDGRLHMSVMNRSNDIHWGLFGVNLPQFAMLQNYMAGYLDLELGTQVHFSDSLHLYLDSDPHNAITNRMLNPGPYVTKWIQDAMPSYKYSFMQAQAWEKWQVDAAMNMTVLLTHASIGRPARSDISSIFTAVAWELLRHYVGPRFSLEELMYSLDITIDRRRDFDDQIPWDWIFGCLISTCWYKTKEDPDKVVDFYLQLRNKYGDSIIDSDFRRKAIEFINS